MVESGWSRMRGRASPASRWTTGDTIEAGVGRPPRGVHRGDRARRGSGSGDVVGREGGRMPADGMVIAKEAFRLVGQFQGYQGEEVLSYLVHAYGTNLQFG